MLLVPIVDWWPEDLPVRILSCSSRERAVRHKGILELVLGNLNPPSRWYSGFPSKGYATAKLADHLRSSSESFLFRVEDK
ncbi:hypothetical protein V2J09_011498 [Rumex salicifolius]